MSEKNRDFKQVATAGATTAAVNKRLWESTYVVRLGVLRQKQNSITKHDFFLCLCLLLVKTAQDK